jgi:hypothetical protein
MVDLIRWSFCFGKVVSWRNPWQVLGKVDSRIGGYTETKFQLRTATPLKVEVLGRHVLAVEDRRHGRWD